MFANLVLRRVIMGTCRRLKGNLGDLLGFGPEFSYRGSAPRTILGACRFSRLVPGGFGVEEISNASRVVLECWRSAHGSGRQKSSWHRGQGRHSTERGFVVMAETNRLGDLT